MNYKLLKFCAWLLGCLFTGLGLMLVLKFIYILAHGDTIQPMWVHVIMTFEWGAFPLFLGVLLLQRKFQFLKTSSLCLGIAGILVFGISSIIHLSSPMMSPRPLGLIAVSGLSFAFLSAIVWVLVTFILRARRIYGRN